MLLLLLHMARRELSLTAMVLQELDRRGRHGGGERALDRRLLDVGGGL